MQSLTQSVYVDDLEAEEEGIAELLLDENAIASVPRPGTSLTNTARPASSQLVIQITLSQFAKL